MTVDIVGFVVYLLVLVLFVLDVFICFHFLLSVPFFLRWDVYAQKKENVNF